jgi:murein DD-endopeptidase MepM/ murein hydrolase activator NlpD
MSVLAALALLIPAVLSAPALAAAPPAGPGSAGNAVFVWPLRGPDRVVRPFEAPPSPYAAGHRGVDLVAAPGGAVLAAGAGVVRFAGRVAGRGVVVLAHADGVLTEYEPVTGSVPVGRAVRRGEVIGTVHGRHGECTADRCLHWGARGNGAYFDPTTLVHRLGPVRLVPWEGPG